MWLVGRWRVARRWIDFDSMMIIRIVVLHRVQSLRNAIFKLPQLAVNEVVSYLVALQGDCLSYIVIYVRHKDVGTSVAVHLRCIA